MKKQKIIVVNGPVAERDHDSLHSSASQLIYSVSLANGMVITSPDRFPQRESEWQIRGANWVAICPPPFHRLKEKLYHEGFRGWRYFDINSYRGSLDSKIHI